MKKNTDQLWANMSLQAVRGGCTPRGLPAALGCDSHDVETKPCYALVACLARQGVFPHGNVVSKQRTKHMQEQKLKHKLW